MEASPHGRNQSPSRIRRSGPHADWCARFPGRIPQAGRVGSPPMTGVRWKLVVLAVFLVSRLVLLSIDVPQSTLAGVNVLYGFEVQRARALGLSFYDLHERNREEEAPSSPAVERQVEYP